jgi:hypothetical protein
MPEFVAGEHCTLQGVAGLGILSVRQAKAGVIQPVQVRLR